MNDLPSEHAHAALRDGGPGHLESVSDRAHTIMLGYLLRLFKIMQVTHGRERCTHPPHSQRYTSGLAILAPMPMPDEGLVAVGAVAGVADLRENMRQVRSADGAR